MTDRLRTLDDAVAQVRDGSVLYVGGAVLRRKPMAFCHALVAAGRRDLHLVTFAGSLEVEVLLAGGAVSVVSSAYVGLGHHGTAPHFRMASESGDLDDREHSEWSLIGRLRAAEMGVPFLPTRGGTGSEIVEALGYVTIEDPYEGGAYLAVPPLRPDVSVLHAWRGTVEGDVQFAWPPEHLWDVDVLAARAAHHVIVTVDEVVGPDLVAAQSHLTRLFGFEVDAVVHVPDGAWPTASPPTYEEDEEAISAYLASSGDVSVTRRETV